jgi:hypothetical protein
MPLPCADAASVRRQLEALLVIPGDHLVEQPAPAGGPAPCKRRQHGIHVGPSGLVELQPGRLRLVT